MLQHYLERSVVAINLKLSLLHEMTEFFEMHTNKVQYFFPHFMWKIIFPPSFQRRVVSVILLKSKEVFLLNNRAYSKFVSVKL